MIYSSRQTVSPRVARGRALGEYPLAVERAKGVQVRGMVGTKVLAYDRRRRSIRRANAEYVRRSLEFELHVV
jgi:hypothetical protein